MDYNLYFNPTVPLEATTFNGFSWSDWQQTGKDQHSLYTDPLFVNPDQFDFRLKPESPAFKLGFQDIDVSQVGVRKKP
jgi:hypothetical protein